MKHPFCKPAPVNLEKRRVEILSEMVDYQRELLREMSGVDKHTLQRIREIMEDYYNIKNNLSGMLANFTSESSIKMQEYELAISKMNDDFIKSLKETIKSYILKDVVNQAVNEAVSDVTAAGVESLEVKTNESIVSLDEKYILLKDSFDLWLLDKKAIIVDDSISSIIEGLPDDYTPPFITMVDRSISSFVCSTIEEIGSYAFYGCKNLSTLTIPNVKEIGSYAFYGCSALSELNLHNIKTLGSNSFRNCTNLTKIDLNNVESIGSNAFQGSNNIKTIIIRSDIVPTLTNTNALNIDAIADGEGFIYVKSSLIESFKVETNWNEYDHAIRAIEDYPEITGG